MTIFPATRVLTTAPHEAIARTQASIATAQRELASGRHDDVGLELGGETRKLVMLHQKQAEMRSTIDRNAFVTGRLELQQVVLEGVNGEAQRLLDGLLAARGNPVVLRSLSVEARNAIKSLTASLNTSNGDTFLFAGTHSDRPPISDYFQTPPAAAKTALDAAFQSEFGMAQSDAGAVDIEPAAMRAFLGGGFADLFESAAWKADWSLASDEIPEERISSTLIIETAVSANEPAFRNLARAYTMIADLGLEGLRSDTADVLVAEAAELLGSTLGGVTALRARLGAAQQQLSDATASAERQQQLFTEQIGMREDADLHVVSAHLTTQLTQLEAAYAATARIQKLSLLDFL